MADLLIKGLKEQPAMRSIRTILRLIVILSVATIPVAAQQSPKQKYSVIDCLIKAAEEGNVDAQINLGDEYVEGLNVSQNIDEAIRWYKSAAEQGSRDAEMVLSNIYDLGIGGIQKDYVQEYMWLEIVASSASKDSIRTGLAVKMRTTLNCDELGKKMTPDQIEEAQRLASEWRSRHPQTLSARMSSIQRMPPLPSLHIDPPYTDAARKSGVEGVVSLECIVWKDGTVDNFKVLKGLGFGLDESAINTIATKQNFVPASLTILNGLYFNSVGVPFTTSRDNFVISARTTVNVYFRIPIEAKGGSAETFQVMATILPKRFYYRNAEIRFAFHKADGFDTDADFLSLQVTVSQNSGWFISTSNILQLDKILADGYQWVSRLDTVNLEAKHSWGGGPAVVNIDIGLMKSCSPRITDKSNCWEPATPKTMIHIRDIPVQILLDMI
jgi:TonB family protein